MHPGRSIKTNGENFGPLVRLPCPQCDDLEWFNLFRHSSGFGLLGITLTSADGWSMHCDKCNYPIDISNEDASKALQTLPISKQFYDGIIPGSEFIAKIDATKMTILSTLSKANSTWKCPQCSEDCPNTFAECWNCGSANPNADQINDGSEEINTPSLDKALEDNGTNPYGGMKL